MAPYYWLSNLLPFVLFLTQGLLITATATCYRADNYAAMTSIYTACNANTPYSMCARTQVDPGGNPPDTKCLPNGLSLSPDDGGQYWRQGCTDESWESDYCLKAFNGCTMDGNGNAQVTPCSGKANSSTWCCGGDNTACCGASGKGAITIAATIGPPSSPSTAIPTTPPTNSSSTSLNSTSRTSLSVGAAAGIGVGATVAALALLGALTTWLVLKRRGHKRRTSLRMKNADMMDANGMNNSAGTEAVKVNEPFLLQELDGEQRAELGSGPSKK